MADDPIPTAPAPNGNNARIAVHRDNLMAIVLVGCIFSMVGLAIFSAIHPPGDWSTFQSTSHTLETIITSVLVGHFALSRANK